MTESILYGHACKVCVKACVMCEVSCVVQFTPCDICISLKQDGVTNVNRRNGRTPQRRDTRLKQIHFLLAKNVFRYEVRADVGSIRIKIYK